ncbi:MAG: hypothetical protein BBJ57_02325 [Desulfobacterales bacterium PC51MH44]|nr:MAG: hypothetical protein BBJ57_02325 [Desulfobacterales bacterium PC51MH44]
MKYLIIIILLFALPAIADEFEYHTSPAGEYREIQATPNMTFLETEKELDRVVGPDCLLDPCYDIHNYDDLTPIYNPVEDFLD